MYIKEIHCTSALCKLHRPLGSSHGFGYLFYSTRKRQKTKKESSERDVLTFSVPSPKLHSKNKDVNASIVRSENVNMSVATKTKADEDRSIVPLSSPRRWSAFSLPTKIDVDSFFNFTFFFLGDSVWNKNKCGYLSSIFAGKRPVLDLDLSFPC